MEADEFGFNSADFKPPSLISLTPFPLCSSPAPRRLSSSFVPPNEPVRAAKRLSWLSLQGRLVGAEEATSAKAIGDGLGVEEAMAWEMFSPVQRVLVVAVIAVAVANTKKDREILRLKNSVEIRDQVLSAMQEELDSLCEQVNYFKDKSDDVCQRSSGEYFSGSIKYGGGCGCRRCDFHQLPYDDMMGSAISEFSKWEDTFKYQPCQPEERRMSNLSDWAPSVNSTIDIQLQLDNEQDIYNLRKECEEKDITIKELSLSLDSSKHVRSKRVSELEDIIRRKNTLITKLKKDKMILEQKPMRRSCGFDYLKPDSDSAECSHGLEAFQQSTNGINKYQILEKNCPKDAPQLRRSLSALSVSDCRVDARWLFGYWLNDERVQKGLHIRKGTIGTWVRCNRDSLAFETVIRDVRPYHANLSTKGYRSLVYSGDHDFIVPFQSTQAWIRDLNYSIVDDWRPWIVDGQYAGYTRAYSNKMTFATVKGGGHTAPEYRPPQCYAMFERWISNKSL